MIHLDDVEKLGHFFEIEVVQREVQTTEEATAVLEDLMGRLEITQESW